MPMDSDSLLLALCLLLPLLVLADVKLHRERLKTACAASSVAYTYYPPSVGGGSPSKATEEEKGAEEEGEEKEGDSRQRESDALKTYMARMADVLATMDIAPAAVDELRAELPPSVALTSVDLVRFLIARKGSVAAAREMAEDSLAWRQQNFPISREAISGPLRTGCFFFHGAARDGSPVLHFRNALYDKQAGSPLEYTLAIAFAVDVALRSSAAPSVIVFVHTSHVEGAVNGPADFSFIKPFLKTFSDNYPERLKQLIMYPFPWYGRASWSVVKMFIDRRTQDKVLLLPALSTEQGFRLPEEVYAVIAPEQIPAACGGLSAGPIENVLDQVEDDEALLG